MPIREYIFLRTLSPLADAKLEMNIYGVYDGDREGQNMSSLRSSTIFYYFI